MWNDILVHLPSWLATLIVIAGVLYSIGSIVARVMPSAWRATQVVNAITLDIGKLVNLLKGLQGALPPVGLQPTPVGEPDNATTVQAQQSAGQAALDAAKRAGKTLVAVLLIGATRGLFVLLFLACLVAFAGPGCSFSLERAKAQSAAGGTGAPSPLCLEYDNARGFWGAVEQGAIVCAGASGVSTLPTSGQWRTGAEVAVVGCAIVAGVADVVAKTRAEQWARLCATK
jgi:hypothetical protein